MSEKQLKDLYIRFHKSKTKELKSIFSESDFKPRDLSLGSDFELSVIMLASCNYFQTDLTKDLLNAAEFNYRIGGNYKSLVQVLLQTVEKHKVKEKEYFNANPKEKQHIIIRNRRLWGFIPIPFTKTIEFKGKQNPYTFQIGFEDLKTEKEIIKAYAEMKATLFYLKRILIKNKWNKGQIYFALKENKNEFDKDKIISIMTDIITELQNQAPVLVAFLGDGLAKGVFSGVGKDLWEKVKGYFKSDKEKEIIKTFESNPSDAKQQGKVEFILEDKLKEIPKDELLSLFELFQKAKLENPTIQVDNSKNVLINSTINVGGNFHLGDNKA